MYVALQDETPLGIHICQSVGLGLGLNMPRRSFVFPTVFRNNETLHFGSKLLPMEAGHLVSAETLHFLFKKYLLLFRQQQSFEN